MRRVLALLFLAGCSSTSETPAAVDDTGGDDVADSSAVGDAGSDAVANDGANDATSTDGTSSTDASSTDTQPSTDTKTSADTASSDTSSAADAPTTAPGLRRIGRFEGDKFAWSGSAIQARFSGTGAKLRIRGGAQQFAIVVDGQAPTVLKTVQATETYTLASGLPAGTHELTIWRRTEASQGVSELLGVDVDGGTLLAPPATPTRRIEIVGDSITAGYGNEGENQYCGFTQDTEDHYRTYAALAARNLGADLHAIAWSGIGMLRNYGGGTTGIMPERYPRALPDSTTSAWSFASWIPHVVIVNLGTNDFSVGDPGTAFRDKYLTFVRMVRTHYANAQIIAALGPLLAGGDLTAARGYLQYVVKTLNDEGDAKVSLLEFPTQIPADGYGCDWHPSLATHAKMATLLESTLKTKLGW